MHHDFPPLEEMYALSLRHDETAELAKNYWIKVFTDIALTSKPLSGKWKMAHMYLTRLGVDHDNCAYCGTDN